MSGIYSIWRYLLGIAVGSAWVLSANCATAQIVTDRTLPNNSTVTINGNTFNITGGTQAGRNLFHSFQQFSVPTGGTASFNNGLDIQNIFSRVTGRSVSNIDGVIKALGTANVFFLNPNGIVFGKNASLNIGGSFVATTANAIQFGNLGTFSASVPNNPALLTVNPSALLYNQIAAGSSIQNNSQATVNGNIVGLQVPDGKSLLLVGGNVNLDGGGLTASGGRVELASLSGSGTVGLNVAGNTVSLNIPNGVQRGDVSLSNDAFIDVSGAGGGDIAINARNLNISNSVIYGGIGMGLGNAGTVAGDIKLNATGAITLDQGSLVQNIVDTNGNGNAGNINISAESLSLTGDAYLLTETLGQGNAGNIFINATKSVSLDGQNTGIFNTVGYISSSPQQRSAIKGNGGNIEINTSQLQLTNGAQLDASTYGQGNAGSVIINATKSVSLDGSYTDSKGGFFPTGIFTSVGDFIDSPQQSSVIKGNGGNIEINTSQLQLTNGAQLVATTYGQGNAGNVIVNATKSVSLNGSTGIYSSVGDVIDIPQQRSAIKGNGGTIQINTSQLQLTNGAQLDASTYGQGNAGSVIINATKSVSFDGLNTIIYDSAGDVSDSPKQRSAIKGNAGNIEINTSQLQLTNGAQLDASTYGQGNAGSVIINATKSVSLDGRYTDSKGSVFPTGIFSSAGNFFDSPQQRSAIKGNGGNVEINTSQLQLTNGALLAATTLGQGNGSNLDIKARSVRLDNQALFSAETTFGNGNITIHSQDLILSRGSNITADATGINVIGGNIKIDTDVLAAVENSKISADSIDFRGGQVKVNAQSIFLSSESSITAHGVQQSNGTSTVYGLVTIPTVTEATPKLVSSTCAAFNEYAGGSNFVITGRGGLPPSPNDPLTSEALWTDTRLPVVTPQKHQHKAHAAKAKAQPIAIIPATGWVRNDKGEATLISTATNASAVNTPISCPVR